MFYKWYKFIVLVISALLLICVIQSCKSTKFVPDGEYLLASATVKSDKKVIPIMEMESYIKQKPNFKTFTIFKLPLFLYNLSGRDSTKWINRTLRNAGEPPVLYDSSMVNVTTESLHRMMTNKGYLNAKVTPEVSLHKKRARIVYDIKAGDPYKIEEYNIHVNDTIILPPRVAIPNQYSKKSKHKVGDILYDVDSVLVKNSLVQKNAIFDLDMLDVERDRISSVFRRTGYYSFNKEYIGFVADTTLGNNKVSLDLSVYPFSQRGIGGQVTQIPHKQYTIKEVELLVDHNPLIDSELNEPTDIYYKDGFTIKYGIRGRYIKPEVILSSCFIRPGALYDENMTAMTYSAFSQLQILKNVNISYTEVLENDSTKLLCTITCVPDKRQGFSAEAEGTTNTGKYFGVGAGLGYLHRNTFKGSEVFSVKLRGAYEAITPNFSSFKDNYFEVGGEMSLTLPRFIFPFLNKDFKQGIHASTQFNSSYTYQRRPGYFVRTILSSGVKYIWQERRQSPNRHIFDFIDVNYVHVPLNSLNPKFYNDLSEVAQQYSFKDHFILGAGYTFTRSNANLSNRRNQPIYSLRTSIETAGNLLSLVAAVSNAKPDSLGSKQVFGTNFSQYVRGTVDYSKTYRIDQKNSVAWHLGAGLAYPYGNNKQIPIQKRFFSGGASGVRGWAVRELGPGSYYNSDQDKDNFFYHSGDIRFDANIEFRSKVFWVLELGAFVDAGNIWTIRDYVDQPGGSFKVNKFYKEIALAWGLGFRFDFDFVLIRLDCGWKAYNPSADPNKSKWPISKPYKFKENAAFHIAIGYPF